MAAETASTGTTTAAEEKERSVHGANERTNERTKVKVKVVWTPTDQANDSWAVGLGVRLWGSLLVGKSLLMT